MPMGRCRFSHGDFATFPKLSQNFSKEISQKGLTRGEICATIRVRREKFAPFDFRKGNEENELLDRLGRNHRDLLDCVAFAEASL